MPAFLIRSFPALIPCGTALFQKICCDIKVVYYSVLFLITRHLYASGGWVALTEDFETLCNSGTKVTLWI